MKLFGPSDLLFDVEDSTTSIGADVAELEQDEVESPDEEVEVESDDEPEVELDEDEEEEEEEPESEPEPEPEISTHPFERPSIKDLNKAYPDLFKKFPSLKDMYFREAEYTKVFPTIDDAKEASENNIAFSNIRKDIFQGDGSKFLDAIKQVNEKGLERFASNILVNLSKISQNAFTLASNPLIEDVARAMFQRGTNDSNESMQNAARYLAKFYFGDSEFAEGKKTSVVKPSGPSEVDKEREAFDNEKHTVFKSSVSNDAKSQLVKMIVGLNAETKKSRIDPDDVLSTFIEEMIIEKVVSDIGSQLSSDKGHLRYMDSLWEHAKRNGRTDSDKSRIISAYLARAKTLIPSLRSKYVSEALGKKVRDVSSKREKISNIRERTGASGRPSSSGNIHANKPIDYSKTSDSDILNDNVTYRN